MKYAPITPAMAPQVAFFRARGGENGRLSEREEEILRRLDAWWAERRGSG